LYGALTGLLLDVRKVAAEGNVHGDLAVALRLFDVIADECLQRGVPVLLELALDQVGAAAGCEGTSVASRRR